MNEKDALNENRLGKASYIKRDFPTSISHFEKAISLDPTKMVFHNNLAAVYFETDSLEKCVRSCETAMEVGRAHGADSKLVDKVLRRLESAHKKMGNLTVAEALGEMVPGQCGHHSKFIQSKAQTELRRKEKELVKIKRKLLDAEVLLEKAVPDHPVKRNYIDVQIDEAREQMKNSVTSSTPPANPICTSTKKMEVKVIKCKLLDSQIAEAREQVKIEKETKRKKMEDGKELSTKKHNGSVEINLSDFLPKRFFPKLDEDSDSSEEGKDQDYKDDEKVLDNAMEGILTATGTHCMRNGDDSDSSEDSEEENVIKFKVSKWGHKIPFVSLSDDLESDISLMINADEIVVPEDKQSISVVFDYPLKKKFVFELESPSGKGFTREELVTAIANKYQEIYMEEEETSELPVETMAQRYGGSLLNRAETEGKYGIWGHQLEDLALDEVTFKPEKNRYYLSISS